jgi:hypothetical protein
LAALIDQLAELKTKGISIERTTTSDYVKTATVTDPAGNQWVRKQRDRVLRIGDGAARC